MAREYLLTQEARAKRGEISPARPKKLQAVIEGTLDRYAGSTQIHLIGDERWGGYPAWRRENGAGRHNRNGVRDVTAEVAKTFADQESARLTKVQRTKGIRILRPITVQPQKDKAVPFISDSTIRFEMSIFGAIMNYAVKKRYVPASQRFDERPKLKTMRRDEFTVEEYRKLHTVGRKWVAEADKPSSSWYRSMTYNLILIACNTGMRPAEMKNLRWRDIMPAKDREGREIVVLFVQGKGKSRRLVAPKSVGDYLERIRTISKTTEPDDHVFTMITGRPAKTLYSSLIADLLTKANLREGTQGVPRSTYCFRHLRYVAAAGRCRRVLPGRADGHVGAHDREPLRPCEYHQARGPRAAGHGGLGASQPGTQRSHEEGFEIGRAARQRQTRSAPSSALNIPVLLLFPPEPWRRWLLRQRVSGSSHTFASCNQAVGFSKHPVRLTAASL